MYGEPRGGRGHFIAGLLLTLLVLIVAIVGLYSHSWYTQSTQSMGIGVTMNYGLWGVEGDAGILTVDFTYDELQSQTGTGSPIIDVARLTRTLLMFGMILLVVFLLMAVAGALERAGEGLRRAMPIVGFLAGIVLLLTAVYFAVAFPDAIEEDSGGTAPSGSLGGAWFGLMLGALLVLLAAELARRAPAEYEDYSPDYY